MVPAATGAMIMGTSMIERMMRAPRPSPESIIANINNFNVIYLLSAGKPTPVGETAGKTDLLVTWLYKLTVDYQYYNIGAVIGILTFVVLSIVALVTYRNTKAYKDEEGFM